jgi:REP element-mobilizing transposase RayT
MSHTYTNHLYHGVYSTKERRPWLEPNMISQLASVIGRIVHDRNGNLLAFNAMPDHVHLLAMIPPAAAVSTVFRDVKAISTNWIKETFPHMRDFAWQGGYSSFTVGMATLEQATQYIRNQQNHHQTRTFEEELISLLEQCGIQYDPRYVFG